MSIEKITLSLVTNLIAEQFPQLSHLSIKAIEPGGWDNRSFRLGDDMLIRLPSAKPYAQQPEKEQQWLPFLSLHLSFQISQPVFMGQPSEVYSWCWSIYKWIDGESTDCLNLDETQLQKIALNLARFLNELHEINATDGPVAGVHNYYRGGDLSVYDQEVKVAIIKLQDNIDVNSISSIWETAKESNWNQKSVWVHGDLSSGNFLIKDGKLKAIIDFGCVGVGDPACDLTIAWTLLKGESRKIFKSNLDVESSAWTRARGWALWKALTTIVSLNGQDNRQFVKQLQIIDDIAREHKLNN